MISILPVKEAQKAGEIRTQNGVPESCEILLMQDGAEAMGFAAVRLEADVLHLEKLHANAYDFSEKPDTESHFILDSLLRSAASYGENFGAAAIETAFPDFFDFLKVRGFAEKKGGMSAPISTFVHYK